MRRLMPVAVIASNNCVKKLVRCYYRLQQNGRRRPE
jgi:hypothetical protein